MNHEMDSTGVDMRHHMKVTTITLIAAAVCVHDARFRAFSHELGWYRGFEKATKIEGLVHRCVH
jgi:hypothetical protein